MNLFKYEGYKVTIAPEALLLGPFKALWARDGSEDKATAAAELGYVYFMADPRSDYQFLTDEGERSKAVKSGEGLPPKWRPDAKVKEAMAFYKTFVPTAALLLADTRVAVDKLRKLLRDIDLNAVDDKGKPIYTLSTITSTIKQVPSLAKELDEAEKTLAKEMKKEGRMRGSGEKTIMEDTLDI